MNTEPKDQKPSEPSHDPKTCCCPACDCVNALNPSPEPAREEYCICLMPFGSKTCYHCKKPIRVKPLHEFPPNQEWRVLRVCEDTENSWWGYIDTPKQRLRLGPFDLEQEAEQLARQIVEAVNFCKGTFTETLQLLNQSGFKFFDHVCADNQRLRLENAALKEQIRDGPEFKSWMDQIRAIFRGYDWTEAQIENFIGPTSDTNSDLLEMFNEGYSAEETICEIVRE